MTKKEALEFLELPETANDLDIKARLTQKLSYFEMLSEKSPSAFLRRIHTQNVEKVKLLQKESMQWVSESPAEPLVKTFLEKSGPTVESASVALAEKPKEDLPIASTGEGDRNEVLQKQGISALPTAKGQIGIAHEPELPKVVSGIQPVKTSQDVKAVLEKKLVPRQDLKAKDADSLPPETSQEHVVATNLAVASDPDILPSIELSRAAESAGSPNQSIKPHVDEEPEVEQPYLQPASAATVQWPSTQSKPKPAPLPIGWLVRHTENQSMKSFPLYAGKNFIGRKVQPGLKPFIEVEEDPFVSRVHAALYAEGAGPYTFYISDTSATNGGKPSKNGTYVNGSEERINTKVKLNEYDTVQIGVTKFVLRYKIADQKSMLDEVEDKGYMHTVVIKLRE